MSFNVMFDWLEFNHRIALERALDVGVFDGIGTEVTRGRVDAVR